MQNHAMSLDLLLQRDERRVRRIVPELAIDLGVEENVTSQQRLGEPMLRHRGGPRHKFAPDCPIDCAWWTFASHPRKG
jgi:hypothetical protein